MTDSPRRGCPYDPNQPPGTAYPGYTDPAYAGSSPYGPSYSAAPPPSSTPNPTEPLPQYWTQTHGQVPPGFPPEEPPPEPPRSPRWLWFAAAAAILLVVGLIIALVIVNSSSKKPTVVAPLPAMPETTTTAPRTTTTRPTPVLPAPTSAPTTTPSESAAPGQTESVVYEVTGRGRAINITYVDTGNMMQTEFNVVLPWRKEVDLPKPATDSASVTVINVGRDVTCTITVSGVQVRTRTGAGLTICSAAG
jgi:Mycobacterium membrane protein